MSEAAIIFDWDCTLAEPVDRAFYGWHRHKTKQALAAHFGLSRERVEAIEAIECGRGARLEALFFDPALAERHGLSRTRQGEYTSLCWALESIDPAGWFAPNPGLVALIRELAQRYRLFILSNSPRSLLDPIARQIGLDLCAQFEAIECMTCEEGPPKYVDAFGAFARLIAAHRISPPRSWSVGDNMITDIGPAQAQGLNVALVDNLGRPATEVAGSPGRGIEDVLTMLMRWRPSLA